MSFSATSRLKDHPSTNRQQARLETKSQHSYCKQFEALELQRHLLKQNMKASLINSQILIIYREHHHCLESVIC
jgi:hypothetical protein